MQNRYKGAVEEMLKGIAYLLEEFAKHTTKCYDGIITAQASNGKWTIKFNGESHDLKPYGNVAPATGKLVKVIIPQGNMSVAFFI